MSQTTPARSLGFESGPDFELRGLGLARALHDPSGTQGSIMFQGREHDGVFVSHDRVDVYEFTTLREKAKAVKDGEKIAELLAYLRNAPENALKTFTGWFVTREEVLAEQRTAIAEIARKTGHTIHAIKVAQLYTQICNSEQYIQRRDMAPFGSIALVGSETLKSVDVPVVLHGTSGRKLGVTDLAQRLTQGARVLVTGDYGVGKSHTLRQTYQALRKAHFRQGNLTPFPIHLNLRDAAGLRSPSEIFRRHAEEIGFNNPDGLISAWRAGMAVLLLDGFDEVVPSRWLGNAADLKQVRWEALAPIRRLIQETPANAGVVVCGRSHYFSGSDEMASALGLQRYEHLEIPDFDDAQLATFLTQAGVNWTLPDWAPTRPLLLGYLVSLGREVADVLAAPSRADGWLQFFRAICAREAQMFSAVRPETIERIVARVATLARSKAQVVGPLGMDQLRAAWVAVNGFQPDEEGMQLLLRLPGLAIAEGAAGAEDRIFVDRDLAETAYGLELADYIRTPHDPAHPLATVASWVNASTGLGTEVATNTLTEWKSNLGLVSATLSARQNQGGNDAVLADAIAVATSFDGDERRGQPSLLVSGVFFELLTIEDHPVLARTIFKDCVIERLDLSVAEEGGKYPEFQGGIVGFVDGLASLPTWLETQLRDTDIEAFSTATQTTAGIMRLNIDRESRVALSILKKVFSQRGSARKEGALSRGLDLRDRGIVPEVVSELVSQGWLRKVASGNETLYVGVRDRQADALRALSAPGDFRLG